MNIYSIISQLMMTDEELLKACKVSHYQASGPGGQKRNRVYSAVRLTHPSTALETTASEYRQASLNLSSAIRKLRLQTALSFHPGSLSGDKPIHFPNHWPVFQAKINPKHRDFPNAVLLSLYLLSRSQGEISKAARQLGVSTSLLTKFLRSHKQVWKKVQDTRLFFEKRFLK